MLDEKELHHDRKIIKTALLEGIHENSLTDPAFKQYLEKAYIRLATFVPEQDRATVEKSKWLQHRLRFRKGILDDMSPEDRHIFREESAAAEPIRLATRKIMQAMHKRRQGYRRELRAQLKA